jgi:hypothetical protein
MGDTVHAGDVLGTHIGEEIAGSIYHFETLSPLE